MRSKRLHLVAAALACFVFFGCDKKTEELTSAPLSDYFPLQVGKYTTYRLDSTVFTNFGSVTEIHSYQEKHIVDAQITDALGRNSYRILRFIRDTMGLQPWRPAGSYFITPLDKQIEVIENNLRIVKMHLPIKRDFSWKGNMYLNFKPFGSLYNFSNDIDMSEWDFSYESLTDTVTYQQQKITGVVRILQVDQRNKMDTVDVAANRASIPQDVESVWLRGNATDTIILNTINPTSGHEYITIFNRTNFYASLNKILIPPGTSLQFQYYNGKWYYPNPLNVINNRTTLPGNTSLGYIFGTATDTIRVDVSGIDTFRVKAVKIYNKSNFVAVCNFNTALSKITIPPGFGRSYELYNGQWRLTGNSNTLLDKDPYSTELPFGSTNYSTEKYAKGLGLVYQELLMWEYQPPNGANPNGFRNGFGVKRSIIDHN